MCHAIASPSLSSSVANITSSAFLICFLNWEIYLFLLGIAANLTEKLLEWTGERWIISLSKNFEAKSVYEKNIEAKNNFINEFKKGKTAKEIETAFPDAKLIDIEED